MPYVRAMSRKSRPNPAKTHDAVPGVACPPAPEEGGGKPEKPERPDPTRYGDWEIDGRCIDF